MQIVINIDDDLYTRLFDNGSEYVTDVRKVCVAIRKGTPLPKGHGRLIDADRIIALAHEEGAYDYVSAKEISDAPTIIEADNVESEV